MKRVKKNIFLDCLYVHGLHVLLIIGEFIFSFEAYTLFSYCFPICVSFYCALFSYCCHFSSYPVSF